MTPLITRIENASGPDRELDAEIAVALDLEGEWMSPPRFRLLHRDYGGNNSYADIGKHHPRLPAFTASLDAALTLVPEGWDWAAGTDGFRSGYAHCVSFGDIWETFAATPALALCAAALKARKEMEG